MASIRCVAMFVGFVGFVGVALGQQDSLDSLDCSTIDFPTHVDPEETLALFSCNSRSGRGGESDSRHAQHLFDDPAPRPLRQLRAHPTKGR